MLVHDLSDKLIAQDVNDEMKVRKVILRASVLSGGGAHYHDEVSCSCASHSFQTPSYCPQLRSRHIWDGIEQHSLALAPLLALFGVVFKMIP